MKLRRLGWAALLGLSALPNLTLWAGEPGRIGLSTATPIPSMVHADPQKLADAIAGQLNQAGTLKDYRIDIAVRAGVVELTGSVTDQVQRDEVLRLVQGVPGVNRITDRMTTISPAIKVAALQDKNNNKPQQPGSNAKPELLNPPTNAKPGANNNGIGGSIPEPQPIYSAANPGYSALNPPKFPPYAWPTYAPYNNYSRVAYPLAYPYKSWPFIGPLYPYPKVPLGWRSVKLEWDDGFWWFSRVGCKHDWWKLRYW